DSRAQSQAQSAPGKCPLDRIFAAASLVGADPAWVHLTLSRGVRGRPFFAELSSSLGWRRGNERRIARIGSYRDGRGPYFCSSAASSLSKNADHDRCAA